MAAWLQTSQQLLRMAAMPERAIHAHFARPRREDFENLRHHDRAMRSRGRLSGREHFRDCIRVTRGIVLFVFLVEAPRIFSR